MLTPMGNEEVTAEPVLQPPVPRPASKTPLWIALAAAAGLVVGVVGTLGVTSVVSAVDDAAAQTQADGRLADAVDACDPSEGVELGDGGSTVVIDVQGDEDTSGATYVDLACILGELDVPTNVVSHIDQTTSMDGRQTESWDGITVQWSYHPDRGPDMVITLE